MEQRGVLLRGIARVLNAGGSALVNVYDAAAAIKTGAWSGEKGKLKIRLRGYEKKLEQLYREIGREVAQRENIARTPTAAVEAGVKLVAECRREMDKIIRRIQEIEAEEKVAAARESAAPERAVASVKTTPEPTPLADTEEFAVTAWPEEPPVATTDATDTTKEVAAEGTETPAPEMVADAAEAAEPEPAAESTDKKPEESADILAEGAATEAAETVVLETLLKSDLMQICIEKGIQVHKRMTKAEMIELISGHS